MTSTFLRRTTSVAVLLGALALAAVSVAASNTTVTTHKTSQGKILANSKGFSLYNFPKDTQGGKGKAPKITCYGKCATAWPPVLVKKGAKVVAGSHSGVNSKMLGTTKRRDGSLQVTYNGWPIYSYGGDSNAGDSTGEGVQQFGAAWYLLKTNGQQVKCPQGEGPSKSGCLPQTY
jgi:predicted lipoprotein with Yx(FWY)xxD motif